VVSAIVVASSGCFTTCLSVRAVLYILWDILGFQLASCRSYFCYLIIFVCGGMSNTNSKVLEVSLHVCEFSGSSVAVYDRGVMAIGHFEMWNSLPLRAMTIPNVRVLLA